jgi:hypothetical protein
VRVERLGEKLGALRLCESEALSAMQRSLDQHGQLASAADFSSADDRLEMIDGFKRLRAARRSAGLSCAPTPSRSTPSTPRWPSGRCTTATG